MTGRVGRPCWSPTQADREKIQAMAALGIQQEKIAAVFKVSEKTLRKNCKTELETAEAIANAAVGRFLFDAAVGKETYVKEDGTIGVRYIGVNSSTVTAAIFWMKTKSHWKETMLHSGNGPEGAVPLILYEWDCPEIWGIRTIGIEPVGYVAGWRSADGMDGAFGWDGD